ncbi:MAG: hypothetical protein KBA66_03545 [Leptospiraceae bacterium]|nr:hypothetical protein [Leptospiraceae bacterium]
MQITRKKSFFRVTYCFIFLFAFITCKSLLPSEERSIQYSFSPKDKNFNSEKINNWIETTLLKKYKIAETLYKNAQTYKVEIQYTSKYNSPGHCFFFFTSYISENVQIHIDQIYFMEGYGIRQFEIGPLDQEEYKTILNNCIYPLKEKFQLDLNLEVSKTH